MTRWTKDGALNIPLVREEWQRALNRSRVNNASDAHSATVAAGEEWRRAEEDTVHILDNSYIRYVCLVSKCFGFFCSLLLSEHLKLSSL